MKKTIKKEVLSCDRCNKENYYLTPCMLCGEEMCSDCREKHGKNYNYGVYVCGSGDGFYCKPCDAKLTKSGDDKRHNAYRADFRKRQKAAEDQVKALSR